MASPSISPSISPSASHSFSSSVSRSISRSASVSPSPSVGYSMYSRGNYLALPATNSDLETMYSDGDETAIATDNGVRVGQSAVQEYMLHQFKNFVGENTTCQLNWDGQSTLAPTSSTVYLQIYNINTSTWDAVDSDNASAADTDFVLTGVIADLTNYKDAQKVITCRVYQLAL